MNVRLSGILSDVNGKLGGSCFARNHYGLYMKNWQIPANPQSQYQSDNRTNFATLVNTWQGLTDAQRIAWNVLGSTIKKINKVGEAFTPSGFDTFISCNQNRYLLVATPLVIAPQLPVIPQCTSTSFMYDPSSGNVTGTLSGGSITADIYYLVYVTKRMSPARYYMTQNYGQFTSINDTTLNWTVSQADYLARWNESFLPSWKYFFRFVPIHRPTGFAGLPWIQWLTITTSLSGIGFYKIGSTFILS
jgi:hypothetical protein